MERTKKVGGQEEQKPSWRKIGGGSLRIGNRIIKPGQTFTAWPDEIKPAFRSLVIPVSGDASFDDAKAKEVSPTAGVKPVYKIQPHGKSLFLFDIVDANGKVLNEKSLKKEVAEKLIADLER